MILTADEIREGIKSEPPLISPVSEKRLWDIEGSTFDLTLKEVCRQEGVTEGGGFLFIGKERRMSKSTSVPFSLNNDVLLEPLKMYLLKSVEAVFMPYDLMGEVDTKLTMWENGLIVLGTRVPPGYCGRLEVGVVPLFPVFMEREARFATVKFHQMSRNGVVDPYSGKRGGNNPTLTGTHGER
jgi:deoxycytidine triphosphate deaminase